MLIVSNIVELSSALQLHIDLRLKRLLIERRDQLGGDFSDIAEFVVVQGGDSLKSLEDELGFNILEDADGLTFPDPRFSGRWEWLADHEHCFEMVFIMTDDGFAHVVMIENSPDVDADLLKLCRMYVTDEV